MILLLSSKIIFAAELSKWSCTLSEKNRSEEFPSKDFEYKLYSCELGKTDWYCPVVEQQLESQVGCIKFWAYRNTAANPVRINFGFKSSCEIGAPHDTWSATSADSKFFEFTTYTAGYYSKISCQLK